MKSTGISATLAFLILLVAVANAHPSCGCEPSCDEPSSSGAEIVTYGEPCFCKESLPYSIQVPRSDPPAQTEEFKSYGYSVIAPKHHHETCLQLPVKIQTPIVEERPHYDHLRGKSYGVTVQHQTWPSPGPRRYSFDCDVQQPVKVQKAAYRPSMSISIQHAEEDINPRFGPLSFAAIQTPLYNTPKSVPRLTGLTTTVDRVLVPACEVDSCPYCDDVLVKKSPEPLCKKPYY